jgi:hypothetical protein
LDARKKIFDSLSKSEFYRLLQKPEGDVERALRRKLRIKIVPRDSFMSAFNDYVSLNVFNISSYAIQNLIGIFNYQGREQEYRELLASLGKTKAEIKEYLTYLRKGVNPKDFLRVLFMEKTTGGLDNLSRSEAFEENI